MTKNPHNTILLSIISSPFFLAVPVTLLIILFLPNPVSKYKVVLTKNQRVNKPNSKITYCDLHNDSMDEKVIQFHNAIRNTASVKVMSNDDYNYDQWNFPGYFNEYYGNSFACADLNHDGFKEIYVVYYIGDSVFMGAFQPWPDKKILFEKKFITTVWKRDGKIDYRSCPFKTADLNGDGTDELVFLISAGYSRQPRIIVSYNPVNKMFTKSNSVGAAISGFIITDLNNDGSPEIFVNTSTPGNIPDTMDVSYDDNVSWFMGFDNKLNLLFHPVKRTGYPGGTMVNSFNGRKGKKFLVLLSNDKNNMKLSLVDSTFQIKKEIDLIKLFNSRQINFLTIIKSGKQDYMLFNIGNNRFVTMDEDFNVIEKGASWPEMGFRFKGDLNKDDKEEYVFMGNNKNLIVYDNRLKNPVSIKTELSFDNAFWQSVGIKHNGKKQPNEIYVKTKDRVYYYNYLPDTWYYLKYPAWIGIYGFIVLILWFAQRMQQLNQQKKREVEEKITTLQMKTIKNHMDPHFTFNVLNGLAGNISKGNLNEAQTQIVRFSRLLQGLIKKRDTIYVSLKEEMDFIRNYLELERLRFKDNFKYYIDIDEGVNMMFQIPSMFIQILVENSLKHGLKSKGGIKKVVVTLKEDSNKIYASVEDNGIGRKAAKKNPFHVGSGLVLLNDMIFLNRKLKGNEIAFSYVDLYDDMGNATGTRVDIVINKTEEKRAFFKGTN